MRAVVFIPLVLSCTTIHLVEVDDAGRDVSNDLGPAPTNTRPGADDAVDSGTPLGAPCNPGAVQSLALNDIIMGPYVDDSSVYWVRANGDSGGWWGGGQPALYAMAKSDAGALALVDGILRQYPASNVAIGPDAVYWTTRADASTLALLMRAAKDGSSSTLIMSSLSSFNELNVVGGRLYFVDLEGTMRIMSAALDGTDVQVIVDTAAVPHVVNGGSPVEYAVGDTHAYFSVNQGPLKRLALDTANVDELIVPSEPTAKFGALAVGDDGYVYMLHQPSPTRPWELDQVSTDGGTPTSLTTFGFTPPQTFAVDGFQIYVPMYNGLFRLDTRSAGLTAVGPPAELNSRIAIDATTVRWATATNLLSWCKP